MSDAKGIPQAFCLLQWAHSGGSINDQSVPTGAFCSYCRGGQLDSGEDCPACEGSNLSALGRAIGACEDPVDCSNCRHLQAEISRHPPDHIFWLCTECVSLAYRWAKPQDLRLLVPGHYNEGYCQSRYCPRLDPQVGAPWHAILQIVIGPLPWR